MTSKKTGNSGAIPACEEKLYLVKGGRNGSLLTIRPISKKEMCHQKVFKNTGTRRQNSFRNHFLLEAKPNSWGGKKKQKQKRA